MLNSIEPDNFEKEILGDEKPVLMACLSRDFRYKEQKEILDSVLRDYGSSLKVCLRDRKTIGDFRKFGIEGSPTFIIFHEGREKGRMLGKVERDSLNSFISRILSCLK